MSNRGEHRIGVITPIYNEQACSDNSCHYHSDEKKMLGVLDVVITLKDTDSNITKFGKEVVILAVYIILAGFIIIIAFLHIFFNKPIKKLINGITCPVDGEYSTLIDIKRSDEIGKLAKAFIEMKRQSDEYQKLFESAPSTADKGQIEKCVECPVENLLSSGPSPSNEETGFGNDGTQARGRNALTAPIKDADGRIAAAMAMCPDVGYKKKLEEELDRSVKKYYDIFNNIPNPVFVLDIATLKILDANKSVTSVYDYKKSEITGRSFLDLFSEDEKEGYAFMMMTSSVIHKVRQIHKSGRVLYVTVRISPSEYQGRKVLLVTTGDMTKRLEAEQQLVQLAKMTTLGEMATGIAHELNQPLSVIKTASNYFMRKIRKNEKIDDGILLTMASEIDSHVDRASKIVNHMREFGRKSDMSLKKIQVNEVLRNTFEIFGQQLKLRGIEVTWDLDENLPMVMGEAQGLEQVFINLLINARDAIEEKCSERICEKSDRRIILRTGVDGKNVVFEVRDTGKGIPETLCNKIFEPFFTTKQVGKGTGLGLSISYGIIKDFGGNISAVSEAAGGAAFIITFPVPDEPL